MTIAESYAGTNASWATEYSLTAATTGVQAQTADGVYAPFIDCSALLRNDLYRLRGYEKVRSTSTQRKWFIADIWGLVIANEPLVTIPPVMLMHGWDFTLQRMIGSDRTITWSVRGVTGAVTEAFSGSATMTSTEYFLASASTTKIKQAADGIYQFWLETNALAKSDQFEFKVTEEARDADTVEQVTQRNQLLGDRTLDSYVSPSLILMNGWEGSLVKKAGTDRAIEYSIRRVA